MAIARLHPTNDPELATLMSSLRFDDPLPSAQRFVALDPAALWTGDLAGTDARLGKALERLRTLGATAVVIEASVTVPDGGIAATWFPNRQLPMRADLLSRIAWQCQTRAGVEAYVHMSPGRAWATLGDSGKVRTLFRDLGTHVPISGIFMDDVPRLVRYGRLKPFSDTPWGIRDARNALDSNSLPPREALALEAFRAAAYVRPGLNLVIVSDDKADLRPSAIADLVLIRTRPSAYLATQIGKQMQANGFATIPFSRRVGLWFNSDEPPNARDLISATRSFQRLGGTVIGWAVDDPMRDLPNAKKVAPTVSAATFPVKF